jgi:hypothetical protein
MRVFIFIIFILSACSQIDVMKLANQNIVFPEITYCSVTNGSYLNNSKIDIYFSKRMNIKSVEKNILLQKGGIDQTPVTTIWSNDNQILVVIPLVQLITNNPYVLTIKSSAESSDGFSLGTDFSRKFIALNDHVPPVVLGAIPSDLSTNVPANQTILVNFSKYMDKETTSNAFSLYDNYGHMITGKLGWNDNNMIFQPYTNLSGQRKYSINITTNALDYAGNRLLSNFTSGFTVHGEYQLLKVTLIPKPEAFAWDHYSSYSCINIFDSLDKKIVKYDLYGSFIREWNVSFDHCNDMTIDIKGNIFAVAASENRIMKYDPNGFFYGWIGKGSLTTGWHICTNTETNLAGAENGAFNFPGGIAIDQYQNIYISDCSNNRIQKFDSNGNYITQWGSYGSGDGQLINPAGLSVNDRLNYVYIMDKGNNRIAVFDVNGGFITNFGSGGTNHGQFINPNSIIADYYTGYIAVADSGNYRVQLFDSNFNYITSFGSYGSYDDHLNYPFKIIMDPYLTIVVSDISNDSIKLFVNR